MSNRFAVAAIVAVMLLAFGLSVGVLTLRRDMAELRRQVEEKESLRPIVRRPYPKKLVWVPMEADTLILIAVPFEEGAPPGWSSIVWPRREKFDDR